MGVMSYSEQQKAVETLQQRQHKCPNCGAAGGEIDEVVGLPILERTVPAGIGFGYRFLAALPVRCPRCSYISLFQAQDFGAKFD